MLISVFDCWVNPDYITCLAKEEGDVIIHTSRGDAVSITIYNQNCENVAKAINDAIRNYNKEIKE